MGMGHVPCMGFIISWDNLTKICPVQTKVLLSCLEECDMTLQDLGQAIVSDDDLPELAQEAFNLLCEQFKNNTKVQEKELSLSIGYYDSEYGDIYDDLEDGVYFMVDGMRELTPAGKKIINLVEEKAWTVYG